MRQAISSMTDGRTWTVSLITKEQNLSLRFSCYVCSKRSEALYEVEVEGGELFWFGTSCAKKLKQLTGIDLKAILKSGGKEI